MTKYSTEAQALVDGFRIEHDPDRQRFVVLQVGSGVRGADGDEGGAVSATVGASGVVGEAHYTLLGDHGIDFDHTVVDPDLRGTGLSSLLATRALTDGVVKDRKIRASCWYIAGYLERHPHLAENGA